jgi:hypothetical protein
MPFPGPRSLLKSETSQSGRAAARTVLCVPAIVVIAAFAGGLALLLYACELRKQHLKVEGPHEKAYSVRKSYLFTLPCDQTAMFIIQVS